MVRNPFNVFYDFHYNLNFQCCGCGIFVAGGDGGGGGLAAAVVVIFVLPVSEHVL